LIACPLTYSGIEVLLQQIPISWLFICRKGIHFYYTKY